MSTETIAGEEVTTTTDAWEAIESDAERVNDLAVQLGIDIIDWELTAGDDLRNDDAIEVTFRSQDDLMALQEVTYRGPFEFGCTWDWVGPEGVRWFLGGLDLIRARYRRAIPYADLPELIRCMEEALADPKPASIPWRECAESVLLGVLVVAAWHIVLGGWLFAALFGAAVAVAFLTADVVEYRQARAVLGRLPSRDLKSGDRGAPGLPGHVAAVEVGE